MMIPFNKRLMPAMLAALLVAPAVWGDEETETVDTEVVETVETQAPERMSAMFADFFGSEEEASSTLAGLRDGSIQYVDPDAETTEGETSDAAPEGVEIEESDAGMGWGNAVITVALAEQIAEASAASALEGETGMTAEESINEILYLRLEEGMGWGQIAKHFDMNLGEVISGVRSNRPEKVAVERGGKPEKAERVQFERPSKPERPVKPERPERPNR